MTFRRRYSFLKYMCKYPALARKLSIQGNPEVNVNLFHELGVSSKVRKSLTAEGITVPTLIQHEVLPITLAPTQHSCTIIQSPTGSGKTLTFLIPALQDFSPGLHSLIIVPSRELAIQIEHLTRKLISRGKLSRSLLTLYSGGSDSVTIKDVVRASPPSIIIGTPKRILELVNLEVPMFKFVRRIILDEVDKLLPSDQNKPHHGNAKLPSSKKSSHHEHTKPTSTIMKKLMSASHDRHNIQCIASSATINEELINKLVQCGWSEDYRLISTSEVESLATPKSIRHGFISGFSDTNSIQYNKLDILTTYLKKNPGKAMIVIHRNAPISTFVFELRQRKVNAVPLHEHTQNASAYSSFLQDFQSGGIEAIVATEETIRGTDFMWLDTVFLMNVPRSALEYLHISGRVGRLGRPGRALVIVDSEKEIERMQRIYRKVHVSGEETNVHSVSCNTTPC